MEEIWGTRLAIPYNEEVFVNGAVKDSLTGGIVSFSGADMYFPSGYVSGTTYRAYDDLVVGEEWPATTDATAWNRAKESGTSMYHAYIYRLGENLVTITDVKRSNDADEYEGRIYMCENEKNAKSTQIGKIEADIPNYDDSLLTAGVHNDTLYIITENADEEEILMTVTADGEVTETVIN